MSNPPLLAPERVESRAPVWGPGVYRVLVAGVSFRDAVYRPAPGWAPRILGEVDAYFRDAGNGAVRWRGAGHTVVHLDEPSHVFQLQRRTLADRVGFWGHLLERLGHVDADALLAVVPSAAGVRGCFSVGPRWNSPRLAEALEQHGGVPMRGAVVRASASWGTIAHELGHVLGLPDLYDYALARSAHPSSSAFVGAWDLMGRVPPSFEGRRVYPMAWTRALAGWITPHSGTAGPRARLLVGDGEGAVPAIRLPLVDGASLFIETRVRRGYDTIIPTEGVLLSMAHDRWGEGRGPVRVVGPFRASDPIHEVRFGPHWDAPLRPGETWTGGPYTIRVLRRDGERYEVEIETA